MKHCLLYFTCMLLTIVSSVTFASAQPVETDWEVQGSANFFHTQDTKTGTLTADAAMGYFLTDVVEVGLRQTISSAFIEDARDQWLATSAPFLDLNFHDLSPDDRIIPFVGGFVGAVWNDQEATGTVGPNAGLKLFLSPQTFFRVAYRYEWYFDDVSANEIEENSDRGNHVGTIGIGYVWGGPDDRRGRRR